MSDINLYANVISPLERVLLNTYQLSNDGRVVSSADQKVSSELIEVDQNPISGNADGTTTIDELRIYLDTVAAYQESVFHEGYSNYQANIRGELTAIGNRVGIQITDPFVRGQDEINDYTITNVVYLYVRNNLNRLSDIGIKINKDKRIDLIKQISDHGYRELTTENNFELYCLISEHKESIINSIPESEKFNYLIGLFHSDSFLAVSPSSDIMQIDNGIYGIKTPYELFSETNTLSTCLEMTNLALMMLQALEIPVLIVNVEYLKDDNRLENINGKLVQIPQLYKHSVLQVWIDDQSLFYDPFNTTARDSFSTIQNSFMQNFYKSFMISVDQNDYLSNLRTFFIEGSKVFIIEDAIENLEYPHTQIVNDMLEASFIIDPINQKDDFFRALFNNITMGTNSDQSIQFSEYFLDNYFYESPIEYETLMPRIFHFNPYYYDFILNYEKRTGDSSYLDQYVLEINNLQPINIYNQVYYLLDEY